MPSSQLFELVHSLSQSEKRYFKIFSSFQAGTKVYLDLFNAIVRQKEYDEQKLKNKLNIRAFAAAKKYLYNLIMRSLRSQQQSHNVSMEIKDKLKDVEILFQKGLFEHSNKLLVKAKKLAQAYQKHPLLIEIYQLEHMIANVAFNTSQHKRIFEKGYEESTGTIEALKEQMEHRKIINLLIYKRSRLGKIIRSENERMEIYKKAKPLLDKDPETLLSYRTGIFHYIIKELYYYSIGDIEAAYRSSKNSIRHMESDPVQLKQELNNYMFGLNNLMNSQIALHKYEEIKVSIDKLQLIEANTTIERARIFGFYASKEIIYFVYTGRHKEGLMHVPVIEKQLIQYEGIIHKPACYALYVNIEVLYIVCGKFHDALHWNNRILNDPEIESFHDFYSNARISEIIIHYELDNLETVQSLIRSYYQFLIKNTGQYRYENSLVRFFKNLINITDRRNLKAEFIRFHKELLELAYDPYEREAFDFFNLIYWMESKIENRPLAEIIKERAGNARIS